MTFHPDKNTEKDLKAYYRNSVRYRDDLITHDEPFLEPYLILIERYVEKPARILDLGCGTGTSTRLLNQRGYQSIGVDLSELFLRVEKQKNPETRLLAADALRLPFPDATFKAVTAYEFIEHVPDVPALLEELNRVLQVHGYIIFSSPNLISPYLPAFDLIQLFLGKGGRPVFAESIPQALSWLKTNLRLSIKKKISYHAEFLYRNPDLTEKQIGGDADSVFLANPMDLAKYLKFRGYGIDQLAHAMSWKNKVIAALTPNWAPYIGFVAHKRSVSQFGPSKETKHGGA